MRRGLLLSFFIAATPLLAQNASVVHYGTPCPSASAMLTTQGLPRIGTTFVVTNIVGGCDLFLAPYPCHSPFLALGLSRANASVSLPGLLFGNGCTLLVNQAVVAFLPLSYYGTQDYNIAIPNDSGLIGVQFNIQRATVISMMVAPTVGVEFSDGVECVVGV